MRRARTIRETAPEVSSPGQRRRWVRPLVAAVAAGALLVAAVLARHRLAEWWDTLLGVRWRWLALAAVVQLASMQCLVLQQQVLLRVGGGRAPLPALTSAAYVGNALSVGVPVAGAAAGAAYTYRRLRDLGNGRALVGWVLTVSGVASTVSLAAVLAVGSAVTGSVAGAVGAFVATAAAVVPVVVLVLALRHGRTRDLLLRLLHTTVRVLARWVPALRGAEVRSRVDGLLVSLGSFRLGVAGAAGAGGWSLLNWLLDAATLALAITAVGAAVPWQALLLVWAAGALASASRVSPAGIGVVEAALASALVAAGLPASSAVPAAVVYRLASLWLLVGIGALFLLATPLRPADASAAGDGEPAAGSGRPLPSEHPGPGTGEPGSSC
ncbi:YbhN family protein [Modestobacter sp. I12A-02662]|uniref:lysylphosphatidylglycerol synthase transmembrane domain-containing protein n=1 Tax=Modestobacter sp. I12A-02662 TaxID=1730496 RepID=UPI0034DF9A4E